MRVLGPEWETFGPFTGSRRHVAGRLGVRASERRRELFAQGAEPDGYRLGIRPFEVDRMAALGIGAVPGRTRCVRILAIRDGCSMAAMTSRCRRTLGPSHVGRRC